MEPRMRNEGKEGPQATADKGAPVSSRQPTETDRSEYDFSVLNLLFDERR